MAILPVPGQNTPGNIDQAAPGASRAQQVTTYANDLAQVKGTYQGDTASLKGLTWSAVYKKLAAANPTADPHTLAQAVLGASVAQGLGQDAALVGGTLNQYVAAAGKASAGIGNTPVGHAVQAAGSAVATAVSPITSVVGLVNALGDKNLWIRVAKVSIGGTILIVGLVKLTGADKKIGGMAAKAVKFAPLL